MILLADFLEIKHLYKSFPGTQALSDVSVSFSKGEIHALVGENGAGKSTLIKILAGLYSMDSGEIFLDGKKLRIDSPQDSQREGFRFIHQEILLVPHFSVAENVFLGQLPTKGLSRIVDKKKIQQQTQEILTRLGSEISPSAIVENLGVAERQIVAVARSVASDAKILVLDEPTAPLSLNETETLFNIIRAAKSSGTLVIYISHRLEEVLEIADRVTVLRDGKIMNTVSIKDITLDEIIKMMIGRSLEEKFPEIAPSSSNEVVLKLESIHIPGSCENVSLEVRKGEVLGIFGLAGAGQTRLLRAIFGAEKKLTGVMQMQERKGFPNSPRAAKKLGISLVPEDRRNQGLVTGLTVRFNICSTVYEKLSKLSFVDRKKEISLARKYINELSVVTPGEETRVKYLSGGNQQKVVIGKWLASNAKLFMFNEPTLGVDVGAKMQIYELIKSLAEQGSSVIIVSSEIPELLGLCQRILIMNRFKLVKELMADLTNPEEVLKYAVGGNDS